jgi:hypothetical protein
MKNTRDISEYFFHNFTEKFHLCGGRGTATSLHYSELHDCYFKCNKALLQENAAALP